MAVLEPALPTVHAPHTRPLLAPRRALPPPLLFLAGCGGGDFPESDGLGRTLFPELRLAGPAQESAARVRIEPLPLPADPAQWGADGRGVLLLGQARFNRAA